MVVGSVGLVYVHICSMYTTIPLRGPTRLHGYTRYYMISQDVSGNTQSVSVVYAKVAIGRITVLGTQLGTFASHYGIGGYAC